MYFRVVEKFSPFDGIQWFTTLDYFLGQLNLIHNLLLLILIWCVQTNTQTIHRIYKEPPTATLPHCSWQHCPHCTTQLGAGLCINYCSATDSGSHSAALSSRLKEMLFIIFPWLPMSTKLVPSHKVFQTNIWHKFLISLIHDAYLNTLIYIAHALQ
jgi:hypothetical protein